MVILVVGLSTRAIAESAVRGGHHVITLDYFGDRDQRALVENHSLLRDFGLPFSTQGLFRASRKLKYDAVVYVSNFENHPNVVGKLAEESVLLGNGEGVLRQVRDWRILRGFCQEEDIPFPVTLLSGEEKTADPAVRWLRKPLLSGGGHGIGPWTGEPLEKTHVLQAYLEGRPVSIAFAADGQKGVIIGLTEQLIGTKELGGKEFAWCGNILPLKIDPLKKAAFIETLERIVDRLTQGFGLRGVNGLDFVVIDGPDGTPRPFLVEVNPRYTASMELLEGGYGLNVFSIHLAAMGGRLPHFSLAEHLTGGYLGKGIVFARKTLMMPETAGWTECGRRDIPFPGDRIEAGRPVCTVLAEGMEREICLKNLLGGIEAVRREIGDKS